MPVSRMRCLGGERRLDGDRPPGDYPPVVDQITGSDQLVQRRQGVDFWDRDEVTSAEAADLALDAAVLVHALDAGAAENESNPYWAPLRGAGAVLPPH